MANGDGLGWKISENWRAINTVILTIIGIIVTILFSKVNEITEMKVKIRELEVSMKENRIRSDENTTRFDIFIEKNHIEHENMRKEWNQDIKDVIRTERLRQ